MNFLETSRFKRAYKALPGETKERVKACLRLLAGNSKHPSLHIKKIKGTKDIREARCGLDYRITFQIFRDYFILRNVGRHDPTLKSP